MSKKSRKKATQAKPPDTGLVAQYRFPCEHRTSPWCASVECLIRRLLLPENFTPLEKHRIQGIMYYQRNLGSRRKKKTRKGNKYEAVNQNAPLRVYREPS